LNSSKHESDGKHPLRVSLLLISFLGLTGVGLLVPVSHALPTPQGRTWYVSVGGQSPDGSLMLMGFYPNVIVVDAGDTVIWTVNSMEPHTVTFLSGEPNLNPFEERSLAPIGGNVYNGTGIYSSGLMMQGMSYNLTFTQPGVYVYGCLIHAGMTGVVVVQPRGSPYPYTQAQYDQIAAAEEANDLANGYTSLGTYSAPASPGPNGTSTYYVFVGPSTVEDVTVPLNGSSGVKGYADLSMIAPFTFRVTLVLSGLTPGASYNAATRGGLFEYSSMRAVYTPYAGGYQSGTVVPTISFPAFTADSSGRANVTFVVHGVQTLPSVGEYIQVSGSGGTVAGGDVVFSNTGFMTFYPSSLTIYAGDKVVWFEASTNDVHTVTFVSPGMPIPEFGAPLSFAVMGNNTDYNGTGYYNSGPMIVGQNYELTFTKPGVYTYVCLIHDSLGMIGHIVVLPRAQEVRSVINNTVQQTTTEQTTVQQSTTTTVVQQYTTTQQYGTTTTVQQSTTVQQVTTQALTMQVQGTTAIALGAAGLILAVVALIAAFLMRK
jgi:plastocyanin